MLSKNPPLFFKGEDTGGVLQFDQFTNLNHQIEFNLLITNHPVHRSINSVL